MRRCHIVFVVTAIAVQIEVEGVIYCRVVGQVDWTSRANPYAKVAIRNIADNRATRAGEDPPKITVRRVSGDYASSGNSAV